MGVETDAFDPIHLVDEAAKSGQLVLVAAIQRENPLVARNTTGRGKPHMHSVHLLLAFRQPQYEPAGMKPAFEGFWHALRPTLPPDIKPNFACGATLYPDSWDRRFVHFSGFRMDDILATREQRIISTFTPRNNHASTVLAQSWLNNEVHQTTEDLIFRSVEGVIYPSIGFAELAATCMRMEYLDRPLLNRRPYPFRDWPYYVENIQRGTLVRDLEILAGNEGYLQIMADKCLVGYQVRLPDTSRV